MVVGDDAQSIYGFRGADIRNILEFEDTFPDAHVVKLEQNYRSTQTILDAANAVIRNNRGQKPKSLWTELGQGDPIKVRELEDEHAEARYVTGEIQRLVDEGVVTRGDRGLLPHQRAVAGARGHARAGRDRLPGDRRHQVLRAGRDQGRDRVPDVLVNPQDVGAFTRIVNSPRRGIGSTSISRVLAFANTIGDLDLGRGVRARAGARASARPRSRRCGGSWARCTCCASAPSRGRRSRRCSRRRSRRPATSRRSRPSGRSRRRVGSRTSRSSSTSPPSTTRGEAGEQRSLAEFLQQVALVADADDAGRRRGARDADDAPQRQGARVPDRVHDRLRGGRVPAFAGARRGRRSRRSAGSATSGSRAPSATCT